MQLLAEVQHLDRRSIVEVGYAQHQILAIRVLLATRLSRSSWVVGTTNEQVIMFHSRSE